MAEGVWPLMTLPFPLVLLLRSSLAGAFKKDGLGLEVEGVEEGGLMKGPALLTIDCWQTSNAVWIHPYPLYDSTPSFINPELAE